MKKVIECDHCKGKLKKSEEVVLCSDGAVVHKGCLKCYSINILMPVPFTVEQLRIVLS